MIHVVLMAERSRSDDMAVPYWQPLITSESHGLAYNVFKRQIQQHKAFALLWVEVRDDDTMAVRGYLDVTENVNFSVGVLSVDFDAYALAEIITRVGIHRGIKG